MLTHLLLVFLGTFMVRKADGFAIRVDAHEEECFYETVTAGTKVSTIFFSSFFHLFIFSSTPCTERRCVKVGAASVFSAIWLSRCPPDRWLTRMGRW